MKSKFRNLNLEIHKLSLNFIRAVLAVVAVSIKLVGPNTAVFGTRTLTLEPHTACSTYTILFEYKRITTHLRLNLCTYTYT